MAYKLVYTKTALKNIQKLDPVVKKRIKKKLETLEKNPKSNAKKPWLLPSRAFWTK